MKPTGRMYRLAGWALIAAVSAPLAAHADGERSGARGGEPGPRERGAYEPKDGERRGPEARETEAGRVVFVAGPVRNDADGKRLQDLVRAVKGVATVSIQRGPQEGTVRLIVVASDQGAFPRAFGAARSAGFSLQVAEVNGRPAGGDARREGKGFADYEVRPDGVVRREGDFSRDGKVRPEGDYRREGKERRDGDFRPEGKGRPDGDYRREGKERFRGDFPREGKERFQGAFPREGKERSGGDYRPEGKSKSGAARNSTLLVGPVRSNQEAAQLRQVLLRVEGVRGVALKPGERPNTAIVTLAVAGEDAVKRATRAMQGYRLEVRALGERKDGDAAEHREGDGKRPESGRRDGARPEGERER
ncbi:MAG: hypothetical protein ACO1SX_17245 [Actinomycetota bacterium]